MKKQPIKVNAILKVNELASTEDGVFLNEEQVEAIDTHVATLENSVTTITTERDTALTAQQTAETDLAAQVAIVTERDTTIADLNTQIANLKKNPGDKTKGVVKEADNTGSDNFESDDFVMFASAKSLHDLLP